MTNLHWMGATRLRAQLGDGEVKAVDVAKESLSRCQSLGTSLGALLHVDVEGALSQAAQVDKKRAQGQALGCLAGVPVVVKDNLCTRGVPTTCGSKILEGFVPPYDAHVVERLRQEDAVIVAKANMDEFAMGSSNEHSAFGLARNPWHRECAPGGSSGGSAAAVAAGLAPLALGSDTGGSVRQPGAFCGVVALKPTYGRISRYGLIAFASSLDQVGPFGRSVEDVALLSQAISGHDTRDATSIRTPVPNYVAVCQKPVPSCEGLRVGLIGSGEEAVDEAVRAGLDKTVAWLRERGATVVDIALPHASLSVAAYYLIAPSEASSNLERFDGMRYGKRAQAEDLMQTYLKTRSEGFGPEVKRRIMLGTYALSAGYYDAYYLKAQKVRTLIREDFTKAFSSCDVILSPTAPTTAFRLGDKTEDPLSMYLADVFTLPASLAGLPAINIPVGRSDDGLPVGIQLVAQPFCESKLLEVGRVIEDAASCKDEHPEL